MDVLSVQENDPGIPDEKVVLLAKELNRTLLTFDGDYGKFIFRNAMKDPPSVVFFRGNGNNPESAGRTLLSLLINSNFNFFNSFTVIESDAIRQRHY